ncbi:MAG: hypothetical protein OXB88_04735, partial [Bacteriovoracales bacterium]|nr:hypothetical protein [Bacteriovoracales bacterium]
MVRRIFYLAFLSLVACDDSADLSGNGDSPWGSVLPSLESVRNDLGHDRRLLSFSDQRLVSAEFASGTGLLRKLCRVDEVSGSSGEGNIRVCLEFASGTDPTLRCYREESLQSHCGGVFGDLDMEGEEQSCRSVPRDGVSALECEDGFGAVAYTDNRTVCRLHLPSSTGRCLEVDSNAIGEVSDDHIKKYNGALWAGYAGEQLPYRSG